METQAGLPVRPFVLRSLKTSFLMWRPILWHDFHVGSYMNAYIYPDEKRQHAATLINS